MKLTAATTFFASLFAFTRGDWVTDPGFFDGFDGTQLSSEWRIARRNWGGQINGGAESYNGGVLPENVSVNGGNLRLEAHGNQYTGGPMGINKNFCVRPDGKRVGAAIATDKYFASGRYEVRARIAPELGLASAFWTFHYQEFYEGDPEYQAKPVGAPLGYYAINHEIDVEFPGRPTPAHENFSFQRSLMNTWIGENDDEHVANSVPLESAQNDGAFHMYVFDWHTGSNTEEKRVEFYVDGTLVHVSKDYVPTLASRFWLGAWFPNGWAGDPDFDTTDMLIDWVRITPFHESGDDWTPEHFADFGWAGGPETCGGTPNVPTFLPPPVEDYASSDLSTNVFGGPNGIAIDPEDGCGAPNPASSGTLLYKTTNGADGTPYVRFRFDVEQNDACGYEYSAFYKIIGASYRDMRGATGVRFDIRGSTPTGSVEVLIKTDSNSPCLQTELGLARRNEMRIDVPVTSSWTIQDVVFSTMTDYKVECPFVPIELEDVGSLVFSITTPGQGNVNIDNIEFY